MKYSCNTSTTMNFLLTFIFFEFFLSIVTFLPNLLGQGCDSLRPRQRGASRCSPCLRGRQWCADHRDGSGDPLFEVNID